MPFDGTTFDKGSDGIAIQILRDAREGVAQPGNWIQNRLHAGPSSCAVGWVARVVESETIAEKVAARCLAPALLSDYRPGPNYPAVNRVMAFNDAPSTRQNDVVALFDRAIMLLEVKQQVHDFHGSTSTNAPLSAVFAAADQNNSNTLPRA